MPIDVERPMTTYSEAPNKVVSAANGIDYAYREVGDGAVPVVLLQHFRGNLDNWDPALIDALASSRRVVAFDNVGVGMTTGTTPSSVVQMAHDALAFLSAMNLDRVDLLGFSIGSFVAQEIALLEARHRATADSGLFRAEGSSGHARLGAGCDRRRRPTRAEPRWLPGRVLRPVTHEQAGGTGGVETHVRPGSKTETGRRPGKPAWLSMTPCARGGSQTTVSCSD